VFHRQLYIPFADWLLVIGTIMVTAAYSNTTKLGYAYGVCVVLVTSIKTSMIMLVALIVWRLALIVVVPVYLVLGAFDICVHQNF
jgi:KUP system potassium uptake protein